MKRKTIAKNWLQKRAEDLKTLKEQRAELVEQMKELAEKVQKEERAMTEEEDTQFSNLDEKVKAIDSTIIKLERARDLKLNVTSKEKKEELKTEEQEERAFERYIRAVCAGEPYQERAGEQNITMGNNGAVIPETIANRIIKTIYMISVIDGFSGIVVAVTRFLINKFI